MNIHFEKANLTHKETIFSWLEEPHIKEFWDNSKEHKEDILNFINAVDSLSRTFFIDPDENNLRAIHVYSKAGFKQVEEYKAQSGAFKGNTSYLMVKNI